MDNGALQTRVTHNGRPRVVVSNWVHPEVLDLLGADCDVISNSNREQPMSRADIVSRGREAQALIAFMPDSVDDALLEALPALKVVACALKGFDNFDVEACTRRGVRVCIVKDLLTVPTAELAIGLTIALGRHVLAGHERVQSGDFAGWRATLYGRGLAGARVGLVGMGAVGQAIAKRLSGFDAVLGYTDPQRLPLDLEATLGTEYFDLAALLSRSEILILAAPLNASTYHMIDAAALAAMPAGTLLVNPARGSLVDESAVAGALESGQLGGYAADVFEMEDWALPTRPREVPAALREQRGRVLFTPHLGSAVDSVRRDIALAAARDALAVLRGDTPVGAIN